MIQILLKLIFSKVSLMVSNVNHETEHIWCVSSSPDVAKTNRLMRVRKAETIMQFATVWKSTVLFIVRNKTSPIRNLLSLNVSSCWSSLRLLNGNSDGASNQANYGLGESHKSHFTAQNDIFIKKMKRVLFCNFHYSQCTVLYNQGCIY